MAELFVQPKKPSRWWIWVLLILIIAAGAGYYFISNHNELSKTDGAVTTPANTVTDSTVTTTDTTVSR